MKACIILIVISVLFSFNSLAANCTSLGNGNWNNPATWDCGVVPSAGDNITIALGDTVTLSSVTTITGAPVTINIDGVFLFDTPSAKLRLPCGSVIIISATGSIESTGNGQSSHSIRICGSKVWKGTDGKLTGPLVIGIVLPIELNYFDAEASGSEVDFIWQTATEKDNDYFTIEGSSDGLNWIAINRIEGAGTTQEVQNYSFTSPNQGQFEYFRLKQIDFDGNFSYSDVVAVQLVRDELVVYPNPSDGNQLTINLPSNDSGILQILHSDGRIAHSMELGYEKVINLSALDLKTGAYIVQVQQSSEVQIKRLVVK
ncbi:MAG: T9SS type A sorting domain-containing protein [Crocinitomicaceae bacterium]|nr:T9SS type A sorting domain-containing protein [Crocinitomicaceae bacterium]